MINYLININYYFKLLYQKCIYFFNIKTNKFKLNFTKLILEWVLTKIAINLILNL